MSIKDRLKTYLSSKNLSIRELERQCQISNGVLGRLTESTSPRTLKRIEDNSDLNIEWLLTGEGEMLNLEHNEEPAFEDEAEDEAYKVPLIPTPALANSLAEYLGSGIRRIDCQNITSPSPGAEAAIPISGDSMEPKFHDGMVVFIKRINDAAFIPWGNTLVLDTENGAFLKNIYPCEDDDEMIEARSINPAYPTMRIPKASIYAMYRVLNATKFFTTM